ncbi:helix-turn-helix domain-containing protein [Spirillospora sp. NPDC049652]
MALPDPELYITEKDLCDRFGVSRNYVGNLRRSGKLTGWRKFGHRYVYRREDLDRIEQGFATRWASREVA